MSFEDDSAEDSAGELAREWRCKTVIVFLTRVSFIFLKWCSVVLLFGVCPTIVLSLVGYLFPTRSTFAPRPCSLSPVLCPVTSRHRTIAVQDFLQILEEHRKNCERQGKYVEAEIAKNRLEELKLHEENRRREAMRSRQIAERLGVEEAHMLEFQQFNIVWDKKMQDYEERAAMLEEETKARHAQELANFQKHMIESISNKPKFSKELLNLRRVQETLAKAKDYKEAHRCVTSLVGWWWW
jgi:hypothetical protein